MCQLIRCASSFVTIIDWICANSEGGEASGEDCCWLCFGKVEMFRERALEHWCG